MTKYHKVCLFDKKIMETTMRPLMHLCLYVVLSFNLHALENKTYKIGVLAYRGDLNAIQRWEPTARYLSEKLTPLNFEVKPLEYCEIENAIKNKDVDFFIVNPALYINIEYQYGVNRIATLKNKGLDGKDQIVYSTVIFTRSDNQSINSIPDLKNKKFAAVHRDSFGGWIITQKELLSHEINPKQHFKDITFYSTHDIVVNQVISKKSDAGAVRTEILEKMAKEGKIKLSDIKVLNPRVHNGFSYAHSSDLYPEWAFAKTETISSDVSDRVLIELLKIKSTDEASIKSETNGWTLPQVYEPVRQCLKDLKLKPYDKEPFTLYELYAQYKSQAIAIIIFILIIVVSLFYIFNTNRKLARVKNELENEIEHKKEVELKLVLRQDELDDLNHFLEKKVLEKSEALLKTEQEKVNNYQQLVYNLVNFIEKRDAYTAGHSRRVAHYCKLIATKMQLSEQQIELLYMAAILHDIGKISTPDSILLKPDRLSDFEYDIIKTHVSIGAEMIASIRGYEQLALVLENHHERYDGTGYPNNKSGSEIPILSHIMIVADAFDAMTTNRIYKNKKDQSEALEELSQLSGSYYHPDVVKAAEEALVDVYIEADIDQLPVTPLEEERFSYFFKDSLTGLYSDKYYNLVCQSKIKTKQFKYKIGITLNNFTSYNKDFGWDSGNKLLCIIATKLLQKYPLSTIFRVHGDDFMVLSDKSISYDEKLTEEISNLSQDLVGVRIHELSCE